MKSKKNFRSYLLSHSEKKALTSESESVIKSLLNSYPSSVNYQLSFCDDLTWSIWKNKTLFTRIAPCNYYLTDEFGQSLEVQTAPGARFLWDFPAGKFKDTLSHLIKGRTFWDYIVLSVKKLIWEVESESDTCGLRVLLVDAELTYQSIKLAPREPVTFLVVYTNDSDGESVKKISKNIINKLDKIDVVCTKKEFHENELLSLFGVKDYLKKRSYQSMYFLSDEKGNNLLEILNCKFENVEYCHQLMLQEKNAELVHQLLACFYDLYNVVKLYDDLDFDINGFDEIHGSITLKITQLENLKKLNLILTFLNGNESELKGLKRRDLNLLTKKIIVEHDRFFDEFFHDDSIEASIANFKKFKIDILQAFEGVQELKEKEINKKVRLLFKYHCSSLLSLDKALNRHSDISVLVEFKSHCDKTLLVMSVFKDIFPQKKLRNIVLLLEPVSRILTEVFDRRDFEGILEWVLSSVEGDLDKYKVLVQSSRRVLNRVQSSQKESKSKARSAIQKIISESFASDVNELEYFLMKKMAKKNK